MNRQILTATLAAIAVGGLDPLARSETISSTLSNAVSGAQVAEADTLLSASFTTGDNPTPLRQITLLLARTSASGTASLRVYDDNGFEPGNLVGTLVSPSTYGDGYAYATFNGIGLELDPQTKYWVVLSSEDGGTFEWA